MTIESISTCNNYEVNGQNLKLCKQDNEKKFNRISLNQLETDTLEFCGNAAQDSSLNGEKKHKGVFKKIIAWTAGILGTAAVIVGGLLYASERGRIAKGIGSNVRQKVQDTINRNIKGETETQILTDKVKNTFQRLFDDINQGKFLERLQEGWKYIVEKVAGRINKKV